MSILVIPALMPAWSTRLQTNEIVLVSAYVASLRGRNLTGLRIDGEKEIAFLKPYTTIVVQCSTIRLDGRSVYQNEAAVRARVRLRRKDGTEAAPLTTVPPMVTGTMAMIKSMIASEGDAAGRHTYILIFSANDAKGKPLVDVNKKDKLTVVLKAAGTFKETIFSWRTPFDAIAPAPPCARCKEKVSTKWSFCAWCGGGLGE